MTVRYLPRLDPERWYVIDTVQAEGARPPWSERKVSLHGPHSEASIAWNVLVRRGFGLGFEFGRNGSESDLGLSLYAGRLASVWIRLRAPWTRFARIEKDADPDGWYNARHTALRLFPHEGCIARLELDQYAHTSKSPGGWRGQWSCHWWDVVGNTDCETTYGKTGACVIPMPEGSYPATWVQEIRTWRFRRWPGTLRDRLLGPRRAVSYWISVEGGIPSEGKGENSWDCGMDGTLATGGSSLEEGIGRFVSAVLRDRDRYGGPHDLDRPMTISEAATRG